MLPGCLKSLTFADEIIVVDSGSKDKTIDIAKKYNAKIFDFKGKSFSQRRNMGFKKALGEWILYIDADERVTEKLKESILKVVNSSNQIKAYKIDRINYYLGKLWPGNEKILRLFYKRNFMSWEGLLHESPTFEGQVGQLEGELLHYSHRSLEEMINKTNDWSEIEADLRLAANHPPMSQWRFFRVMVSTFLDYYFNKGGIKAGTIGIIESIYQSFSQFITYAKLWEKQKIKK